MFALPQNLCFIQQRVGAHGRILFLASNHLYGNCVACGGINTPVHLRAGTFGNEMSLVIKIVIDSLGVLFMNH